MSESDSKINKIYLGVMIVALIYWAENSFSMMGGLDVSIAQNFSISLKPYLIDVALLVFVVMIGVGLWRGGQQKEINLSILGKAGWLGAMITAVMFMGVIYWVNPRGMYAPDFFKPITIPRR